MHFLNYLKGYIDIIINFKEYFNTYYYFINSVYYFEYYYLIKFIQFNMEFGLVNNDFNFNLFIKIHLINLYYFVIIFIIDLNDIN